MRDTGKPKMVAGILASVGLAQNFAALRALAITDIQRGHMALHARNIAIAAGCPSELVPELCAYMLGRKRISADAAVEYLRAHAIFSKLQDSPPPTPEMPTNKPSIFYVEVNVPTIETTVSINVVFQTLNGATLQLVVMDPIHSGSMDHSELATMLLGDHGYLQLQKMMLFLEGMKSIVICEDPGALVRTNLQLQVSGTRCWLRWGTELNTCDRPNSSSFQFSSISSRFNMCDDTNRLRVCFSSDCFNTVPFTTCRTRQNKPVPRDSIEKIPYRMLVLR